MKREFLSFWRIVGLIILVLGLYSVFVRFWSGLGASTSLTDTFPWGLWIGFDVLVGVGLAAGGFTIAATVYIFNLEKYESISRPSLLTAFLGYGLVTVALLLDIGRPLRLWHPLIMWNPHSVMFEVAWCVTLYSTVLALEFSPLIFERFNLHVPLKIIRMIYIPLVILGVLLSTLHQSSLGTVFLIVPDKLHGIWYTPLLPIFFFLTAVIAGLGMTIIESVLSARAFGKRLEPKILNGLGRVIAVLLSAYLTWKFVNLIQRGSLGLVFAYTQQSVMFWGEIGVGCLLPVIILFKDGLRGREVSQSNLFLSALLVVVGFTLNRLNVSITGMIHSEGYFPKWTEVAATASLVVLGFTVFYLCARYLNIFPEHEEGTEEELLQPPLSLSGLATLWVVSLAGIIAFAMAPVPQASAAAALTRKIDPMAEALRNIPVPKVIPTGSESNGKVMFNHEDHIDYQDQPDCRFCHERFGFNLNPSAPRPKGEEWHSMESCASCHNGDDAFKIKGNCKRCHSEEEE